MPGSAPYEGQLCCAICGDVIPPPSPRISHTQGWQMHAVLLSDPDREFEQLEGHYRGGKRRDASRLDLRVEQEIRIDRAHTIGEDRLSVIDSDEETPQWVQANNSYICEDNGQWTTTPYYIAMHHACLDIAQEVMKSSPHDIVVRDMRTLWKVLRMRFEVDDSYYMGTVTGTVSRPQRIHLPHGYYMPFRPPLVMNGHFPDRPGWEDESVRDSERWEATYPQSVPRLTSTILGNLLNLPSAKAATPEAIAFQTLFINLPAELRDHVYSFLATRNGMSSQCNGFLPQWAWREILLTSECLPFLPKVDMDIVSEFCFQWDKEYQGREPNWELLVRRLSHQDWSIWDAESSSLQVPNELRNRRRIWQLVEEMYVGDLVPVHRTTHRGSDIPAVPRYWDRTGELVYPVIRVKVGSKDEL